MSRFTVFSNNGKYRYVYGYDRPFKEYFFAKYKRNGNKCIFNIATYSIVMPHPEMPKKMEFSHAEILELMMNEEKNEDVEFEKDHIQSLILDLILNK
jgi:hypothetical protein